MGVPRVVFEHRYGLKLSGMNELESAKGLKETKFVPYRKLLVFLAKSKGYASKGRPDESRAARLILKEFVRGQLLFCKTPPNLEEIDASEFQKSTLQIQPEEESLRENSESLDKVDNLDDLTLEDLKLIKDTPSFDSKFFEKKEVKVFIKGQAGLHNKINSQNG